MNLVVATRQSQAKRIDIDAREDFTKMAELVTLLLIVIIML